VAKRCRLGNTYCREARWLWSDCEDLYQEYLESRDPKDAKRWEKAVDKYLAHRKKCCTKRR
jgi:hypothetical protein